MNVDDLSGDIDQREGEAEAAPQSTRDLIRDVLDRQKSGEPKEAAPASSAPEDRSQPQASPDGRQRDDQGRFAPQDQKAPAKVATAIQQPTAAPMAAAAPLEAQPHRAPVSFSPAAKIAFEAASPELRDAIAKRESEVDAGFKKYAGLDHFVRMAEESGTTLPKAVEIYVNLESVLRRDPVAGIEGIAANMGLNPVSLAQAVIHKHQGNGALQAAPQPNGQRQSPAPQQPIDANAIARQVRQQIEAETARTSALSQVDSFKNDPQNRFFENVKGQMFALMQTSQAMSLKEAYDAACWANPEIRAHLMQQGQSGSTQKRAAAAVQARSAAKAVTGAPGPGTRPGNAAPSQNESTRDTVRRALEEARGSI